MPFPPLIITGLGLLLKEAPTLIRIGEKILNKFKDPKPPPADSDTANREEIQALRAQVEQLQERLDTQEESAEAQAELIVQLAKHNASLVRWLLLMAIGLALSSGVAIAALILTFLV